MSWQCPTCGSVLSVLFPHPNWDRMKVTTVEEALEWVVESHEMQTHRITPSESGVLRESMVRMQASA